MWRGGGCPRHAAGGKKLWVSTTRWSSYRWTQICAAGEIPADSLGLKARPVASQAQAPFQPVPLEEALAVIAAERPDVVFAPHVETASGMILPDAYMKAIAEAVHAVGGLFVLDCIASGTVWVDMQAVGVDVLISAPQKGWSASPCSGLVMLSPAAKEKVRAESDEQT